VSEPAAAYAAQDLYLPVLLSEEQEIPEPPVTWKMQMVHARMLLRWRREQNLSDEEPPRNPEPFVL